MRLIAVITDPTVCEKILRHLRLWQRGPPGVRRVVVASGDREPFLVACSPPAAPSPTPQPRPTPVQREPHHR